MIEGDHLVHRAIFQSHTEDPKQEQMIKHGYISIQRVCRPMRIPGMQ